MGRRLIGWVGGLDARLGHGRVDGHARGSGLVDGVVAGVTTVDEQLGGADAGAGLDLVEHRCRLALVGATVGNADADDDAGGVRGGGELDVEGGAETAVGRLHHAGVGVGGRDARRRVLGAALLLDRDDVRELGERVLEPGEPVLCDLRQRRGAARRAVSAGSDASAVPWARWARASSMSWSRR